MAIDWSIVAAGAGFAAAGAALEEYRHWKRSRPSIPMDWNPKKQAYEADYKLRRLERFGRWTAWSACGLIAICGHNAVANGWFG